MPFSFDLRKPLSLSALTVFTAVLPACGGTTVSSSPSGVDAGGSPDTSTPPGVDGGGGTLPCEVDAVLANHCRQCHSNPPQFAAPMPLVTYADLHAPAVTDPSRSVYELVEQRIHNDARPMPQPPNARLSATDTSMLDAWIGAGAPPAASSTCASDAGGAPDAASLALNCTPDEHLASASPWSMPQATDDVYVCYGVELNLTAKRQVIGMQARIDNHAIVHHVLLFQADAAVSPTPAPCSSGGSTAWRIVYGWAPGGQALETPPDVGFAEDSTTHYVVQVHYNNINHLANQVDSSGFDLCSTDKLRPNDADIMAFGTMNINIPPHATSDVTCSITMPSTVPVLHTFAALPHMHQLGTIIATTQLPGGTGAPVDMGAQMNWNFQNQTYFPINNTIHPGDVIKTRCAWNNTTSSAVTFGPYTENEMCYSFTMYYPKILSSQWSWDLPSAYSSCVPTP